jgi:GDP-L-fucose synthase
MNKDSKIFVAGYKGIVGASLVNRLKKDGFNNIITDSFKQFSLLKQEDVHEFFVTEKPEYVFIAAAEDGGILTNITYPGILANMTYPADLIYANLQIQLNLIYFAWQVKVKKLLFLGSSCAYPKFCPQPMKEEYLLTGPLEPTTEAYATAKIAGIKMCQAYNYQYGTNFISAIPTTIYGPNDNFDLKTSHVIPALIRKFHEAKLSLEAGKREKVTIWGTGTPLREFLYVDDFADACLFLMNNYDRSEIINVGYGEDISIKDLALMIKEVVGFDGELIFDETKPDGMQKKLLDTSKMNALGWRLKIDLKEGLEKTYEWFKQKEGIK